MERIPAYVKLTLRVKSKNESEPDVFLISRLEEQENEQSFLVSAPMNGNVMYPLQTRERLDVSYTDPRALYIFPAEVVQRLNVDGLPYVRLRKTGKTSRAQRRSDFRLEVSLSSEFVRVEKGTASKPTGEVSKCDISDISGGGACIWTDQPLEVGERVMLKLPIDMGDSDFGVVAEVRRTARKWIDDKNRHMAGLLFHFKHTAQKDDIAKYVLRAQQQRGARQPRGR